MQPVDVGSAVLLLPVNKARFGMIVSVKRRGNTFIFLGLLTSLSTFNVAHASKNQELQQFTSRSGYSY